jgi:uncharacterized protein YciI
MKRMMEFLVVAHDHTDDEALARRMVVRDRHLTAARRAVASGNMLIGGAILDEGGRVVGSMAVVSFSDQAAFDEWLKNVPYNKNGIWERIEVYPYRVAVMPGSANGVEERADGRHDRITKGR